MRKAFFIAVALLPMLAGGCLSTVGSIVTAPVKVAGKAVDWSTTSQDESDRNYGRKMRKAEAREGRTRKQAFEQCRDQGGSKSECSRYEGERAGDDERR